MRSAILVLLLSVVAISSAYRPTLGLHPYHPTNQVSVKDIASTPEFNDVVNYLEYNLSPSDINELLNTIPEAFDAIDDEDKEEIAAAQPRSFVGTIENTFEKIPWGKITDALKKMSKNNSKFTKVLNLVNDQKFRDLVKKAVNSRTLAEFVKSVATHGFSWTEFLHLMLHGLCSAATTIQHDQYSVGVCKVLQNL